MVKNPPANARKVSSIRGRSPGEGNDNPLQYSCLENSMDRGAWREPRRSGPRVLGSSGERAPALPSDTEHPGLQPLWLGARTQSPVLGPSSLQSLQEAGDTPGGRGPGESGCQRPLCCAMKASLWQSHRPTVRLHACHRLQLRNSHWLPSPEPALCPGVSVAHGRTSGSQKP